MVKVIRQWRRSGVFIVDFEHIFQLLTIFRVSVNVFILLTLDR